MNSSSNIITEEYTRNGINSMLEFTFGAVQLLFFKFKMFKRIKKLKLVSIILFINSWSYVQFCERSSS